jgi:hypothetical protein
MVMIPISLTAVGPPYFVDNYVTKGVKLLIVDLQRLRILATIHPEHSEAPRAFALDHRDGKVTVLVDWPSGWQRLQFAE